MRKRKSRKSKKLFALVGLFAVALIAGISAYFYQEVILNNQFSTQQYGGAMVEIYTPKNNWEPGMEVTKIVSVENTGDYDLFVRVKMTESWTYNLSTDPFYTSNSDSLLFYMAAYDDPIVEPDGTVVYKNLNVEADDHWTQHTDGYFYYEYKLKPGEATQSLLESVTLAAQASMGDYVVKTFYKTDGSWIEVTEAFPLPATYAMIKSESVLISDTGYANAFYTLTITTDLIQADAQAAALIWPEEEIPLPTTYAPLG